MINKLYSILVSGCDDIPNEFCMYRKYEKMPNNIKGVPGYTDPFRRSMWANSIIELAKTSRFYPIIQNLDKANSYETLPTLIPYTCELSGLSVASWSSVYPVLTLAGDIRDNVATYTYNRFCTIMEELNADRTIDILGYKLKIDDECDNFTAEISNPSVTLDMPDERILRSNINYLSDIIKEVDMDDTWDMAALFCIYLLRRYDSE